MSDAKHKSSFVFLLVVGTVIVGLALFVTITPLVKCGLCEGAGVLEVKFGRVVTDRSGGSVRFVPDSTPRINLSEMTSSAFPREHVWCLDCDGEGKVPLIHFKRTEANQTPQ